MPNDYHEDRAYEAGFIPEDVVSEAEFAAMLHDRAHSKNIYQGPLQDDAKRIRGYFQPDEVHVPWWAGVLFLAIFVGGVCGLLWMLS